MANKFFAKKVDYDGHRFDSTKEKNRYIELKDLEAKGIIQGLKIQPEYELQEKFRDKQGKAIRSITYKADFSYYDKRTKQNVVEDVKSPYTAKDKVYRLKMKLFIYKYKELTFIEYI